MGGKRNRNKLDNVHYYYCLAPNLDKDSLKKSDKGDLYAAKVAYLFVIHFSLFVITSIILTLLRPIEMYYLKKNNNNNAVVLARSNLKLPVFVRVKPFFDSAADE